MEAAEAGAWKRQGLLQGWVFKQAPMAAIPPGTAAQRVDLTLYPHDDIRQVGVVSDALPLRNLALRVSRHPGFIIFNRLRAVLRPQAMVEAGFNPVLTVEAPRRKLLPKILAYLEGKWRRAGDRIAGPGSEVALLVRKSILRLSAFIFSVTACLNALSLPTAGAERLRP